MTFPTMGASTQIGYVAEVTVGTTPGTPSLVELPVTQFGLNESIQFYQDQSINPTRQMKSTIAGNKQVAGDIDTNFRHNNYDAFLESLLNSTFSTNVLKPGTTLKTFTIEESHVDSTEYISYVGCTVDKMTLNIPSNGLVTAKFGIVGYTGAVAGSSLDSDGYTAATVRAPFQHGAATFKEGGSTFSNWTSMSLTIDNSVAVNHTLGSNTPTSLTSNWFKVSGTVNMFFVNATTLNKFLNNTSTSIDVTLSDGTNTLEFKMSSVTYTAATKTIVGNNPIEVTMNFEGFYNVSDAASLIVTRSA